ncbi:leucyl aminopeptidase [Telmatospirillum sp. J64-1]|uniref:leucyl aminopeptidase n=1 Tax=Telmatospirillum sp. J64-1 TaxID=2502183 RepID=UPI00115F53B7|nr:leucyl aminopeptidase [Telmatospirillum sp. J64-1]
MIGEAGVPIVFEGRPPFADDPTGSNDEYIGAVVVGYWRGCLPTPAAVVVDRASGALTRALAGSHFAGEEGDVLTVLAPASPACERVILLGLGDEAELDPARLRRLGGIAAKALMESTGGRAVIGLGLDGFLAAQFAYGLRLRGHTPLNLRSRPDPDRPAGPAEIVVATSDPDAARNLFSRLESVAEGVHLARDLVAEPANRLTPQAMAEQAAALEALGVEVEILEDAALKAEGLGLLAGVGQGADNPPCLALLRWRGSGEEGQPPLILAGKGITFDTGGISIKRYDSLHEMKGDMAGAAAVLGAMRALAGRQARVEAVGVLALAENAVSGRALRPGDVLRSYAGKTVEIIDTDAEGRLVLADALAYACSRYRPAAVLSLATLTGAVVTALGRHRAGLFSNDEALAAKVLEAGEAADEPVWRLPILPQHDEDLASDIADTRNCAWGKVPDALHAARFLMGFIPEGVAWGHLDMAGTARTEEDLPLCPKGATGWGVRLLDRLVAEGWER